MTETNDIAEMMDGSDNIDRVTEALIKELSAYEMPLVDRMFSVLMLVGDIIATVDCPSCREKLGKMIADLLPDIMKQANEHASALPEGDVHHTHH